MVQDTQTGVAERGSVNVARIFSNERLRSRKKKKKFIWTRLRH